MERQAPVRDRPGERNSSRVNERLLTEIDYIKSEIEKTQDLKSVVDKGSLTADHPLLKTYRLLLIVYGVMDSGVLSPADQTTWELLSNRDFSAEAVQELLDSLRHSAEDFSKLNPQKRASFYFSSTSESLVIHGTQRLSQATPFLPQREPAPYCERIY